MALLLLTGCGAEGSAQDGVNGAAGATGTSTGGGAAGACLAGAADCEDFPTGTGGVTSQPDGSVLVEDAVRNGIDGPFLVRGWAVTEGGTTRLCSTLLESSPPQCGLPSLDVELGGADLAGDWSTVGDVTWSEEEVTVEGEIVEGVFVVGAP